MGPHGAAIRSKLEKEITGDLQGWPKRRLIQEFRANMSFALMAFIAKQLRASEDALPDGAADPGPAPVFRGGPVFTAAELAEPQDEDLEEVFLGPIRIRGIRARPVPPLGGNVPQ